MIPRIKVSEFSLAMDEIMKGYFGREVVRDNLGNVLQYDDELGFWSEAKHADGNVITKDDVSGWLVQYFAKQMQTPCTARQAKECWETYRVTRKAISGGSSRYIAFKDKTLDVGMQLSDEVKWVKHNPNFYLRFGVDAFSSPIDGPTNFMDAIIDNMANGDDDVRLGLYALVYMMIFGNNESHQYFFELTGEGGTGKSSLVNAITAAIGSDLICTTSLDIMEGNQYAPQQLAGKMAWIINDMPEYSGDAPILKAATGGDVISSQRKNINEDLKFVFNGTVLLVNNSPAVFKQGDGGVERRRIIFHTTKRPAEKVKDIDLKAARQLPAFIAKCKTELLKAGGLKSVLEKALKNKSADQIKVDTDPMLGFVRMFKPGSFRLGVGDSNNNPGLYKLYLSYCSGYGIKPVGLNKFRSTFESVCLREKNGVNIKRTPKGYGTNIEYSDELKAIDFELYRELNKANVNVEDIERYHKSRDEEGFNIAYMN